MCPLAVDSPAGVGFSYSNTTSDYNTNNSKTSADYYTFLKLFFKQYPQYSENQLWLAGESYGGDYVPDAVQRVLQGGGALKSALEGFIIGNPVLSCPEWEATENTIQVRAAYTRAMDNRRAVAAAWSLCVRLLTVTVLCGMPLRGYDCWLLAVAFGAAVATAGGAVLLARPHPVLSVHGVEEHWL